VKSALGGLHSAKLCLYSVDFDEIETLQHAGDWGKTADILSDAARGVAAAGADFLVLCTNTMHKVAPEIERRIPIPLLHIADATAEVIVSQGIESIGLLGTKFTMEEDFYRGRLENNYALNVLIPDDTDRDIAHHVIYSELCQGQIHADSRARYLDIIGKLSKAGAQAIILGCTEIALLVQQDHTPVPLYDTTQIHAEGAVKLALE